MTTAEKACAAALALILGWGVWALLIAAGTLPAAPWSPIGKAHQHTQPGQVIDGGLPEDLVQQMLRAANANSAQQA